MKTSLKFLGCLWLSFCLTGSWNATAQSTQANSNTNLLRGVNPRPDQNSTTPRGEPAWISQPLSLLDCLNLALTQNATILKAKSDLRSTYGLVVQTRAVALPKIQATGQYQRTERSAIENFPVPNIPQLPDQNWNAGIRIVQSIYDGGKMVAAIRSARLLKQQSLLQYQTVVQNTLLNTRIAYYDVLLAAQQITVHEASVKLLTQELQDQQRRYHAGTVPHFNVLRAEVALANERPALIRARNNYRIAKNDLANLLGYNLPRDIWEDIPLHLSDKLAAKPYHIELPEAIEQALADRTELAALRKQEALEKENIVKARSGYLPTVQVFAGYNWYNAQYTPPIDLDHDIHGWNAGAELSWDIFDGMLTRGKVIQAKALYEKSRTDVADMSRQIELEVRTAYSLFIEAREVLASQKTVQAEAAEALREAEARAAAGTGTQLDVLDAQTSLTQARTTEIQALHDYAVARAKLERAIGGNLMEIKPPKS